MPEELLDAKTCIERLAADESYTRLMTLTPAFNLFDFLGRLSENPSSRAIAYLLDSNREHGLGAALLTVVLRRLATNSPGSAGTLRAEELSFYQGASTSVSVEWRTKAGRRLDILVRVYGSDGRKKAVIGIENKHWAAEQHGQIEAYQAEIVERFPDVRHRMVLFLAPEGRLPRTAVSDPRCPCVTLSYKTLGAALEEIEGQTTGDLRVMIGSLQRHLDQVLEGKRPMEREIRELVHALYREKGHRTAIKHIIDYLPKFRELADRIRAGLQDRLAKMYPDEAFTVELWARPSQDPCEIRVWSAGLRNLTKRDHFYFLHLLHIDHDHEVGKRDIPEVEDPIKVSLMAWCDDPATAESVKALPLRESLPPSEDGVCSWFEQWVPFWGSRVYWLQDLGDQDAAGCIELMTDALNATFDVVKRYTQTRYTPGPATSASP